LSDHALLTPLNWLNSRKDQKPTSQMEFAKQELLVWEEETDSLSQ